MIFLLSIPTCAGFVAPAKNIVLPSQSLEVVESFHRTPCVIVSRLRLPGSIWGTDTKLMHQGVSSHGSEYKAHLRISALALGFRNMLVSLGRKEVSDLTVPHPRKGPEPINLDCILLYQIWTRKTLSLSLERGEERCRDGPRHEPLNCPTAMNTKTHHRD
jgi:hypothetical protein